MPEPWPGPRFGPRSDPRPDREAIRAALSIDLSTSGARSGRAHRIEIRFYRAGDEPCLTTAPARRDWYANVLGRPRIVVHLEHGLRADLPATGVPIADPAPRERVLRQIVEELRHPDDRGGVQGVVGEVDDWIAGSPLVHIDLDDRSLLPGDRQEALLPPVRFTTRWCDWRVPSRGRQRHDVGRSTTT
ncbi:hypothetical protein [Kineococcus sp. SYSU DK005]|uniref:hypothetical protein n=1 Tax=Kineococcus sp. SYSU DK005 TaxID=3383126 RepID=UPI003D7D280D